MSGFIALVTIILAIFFIWQDGNFKRKEPFHIEVPKYKLTQPEIEIEDFARNYMHIYALLKRINHVTTDCRNDVETFLDYIEEKYPDDYRNNHFIQWCRYWWGVNNKPDSRHKLDNQPVVI